MGLSRFAHRRTFDPIRRLTLSPVSVAMRGIFSLRRRTIRLETLPQPHFFTFCEFFLDKSAQIPYTNLATAEFRCPPIRVNLAKAS